MSLPVLKVEILVCGSPRMELSELQKVVVYDGYKPNDSTIQLFWEVIRTMDIERITCP